MPKPRLRPALEVLAAALVFTLPAGSDLAAETSAKELCRETALLYAHYADTGQRAKFGELFTHDGVLVAGDTPRKPAQETTEDGRPSRTTRHVATNHIVFEEDGKLTGTSYFTFYFHAEVEGEPLPIAGQPTAMGVYHDEYVIEGGVCKFARREAKATFSSR